MGDEAGPSAAPNGAQAPAMKSEGASPPASTSTAAPAQPSAASQPPKAPKKPTDLKALNVRQYLEATVCQVLMKGMQEVVKQRPDDPLEFLGQFLLKHNPKKQQQGSAAAAAAPAPAPAPAATASAAAAPSK